MELKKYVYLHAIIVSLLKPHFRLSYGGSGVGLKGVSAATYVIFMVIKDVIDIENSIISRIICFLNFI
ncbi:hypothetical protein LCGC14_1858320 [marine sediment metagenome]|uniref:Uncharacterized protein n=1 Tax=marine sediment metagenome TaxID=412755 RepID=A0A0F9G8I1_9ZZZZ